MFKQLKIYYVLVSLPFVMMLLGAAVFFDAIKMTILRNPHPQINYTIFVIIISGGMFILVNAGRLVREAKILALFTNAIHAKTDSTSLQEMANRFRGDLACLLQMVATTGERSISHQEQRALEHELTNARSRLTRRNALPQYLTGLLVGMGLVGTFIGLLATLNDISTLISSFADIDMGNADPIEVFRVMIERMKAPMSSMGIAFSASLFGLLGSIILGLMMVGIRRLEGDVFSVLSSEVARHIEMALARGGVRVGLGGATVGGSSGALTTDILLRIEERLAESARTQQQSLSTETDDSKIQQEDMLRTLAENTEASNNFSSELQKLGNLLGTFFNEIEKGNSEISSQISELTVQMAGAAKTTHKLLALEVNEQKGLKSALDSYNDEFTNQRADMQRTLTEHIEASKSLRSELQQFGSQLGALTDVLGKGS